MLGQIRIILLVVYGVVGVFGWYKYYEKEDALRVFQYDNLSSDMTISYVKSMVWYHSRGKLQEIRSILLTDNLNQVDKIKTRITNMLQHRTSAYIREFNALNSPVKNLGNWYQEHFDFPNFLNEVFVIVFDERLGVEDKIRDISDCMEKYQNKTTLLLIDELKKRSINE